MNIKNHFVLDLSKTALIYLGFYFPNIVEINKIWKKLYFCYFALAIMYLVGLYIIVQTMNLYYVWGDIEEMMSTSFILLTNWVLFAKVSVHFFNHKKIQTLIKFIKDNKSHNPDNTTKEIIQRYENGIFKVLAIYIGISNTTVWGWVLLPLVNLFRHEIRSLPLDAWYPFDKLKSPMFEICYIHQSSAIILSANANVFIDIMYCAIISEISCQTEELMHSLKSLINNKVGARRMDLDDNIKFDRLKLCIKNHQQLYSMFVEIQKLVNPIVMLQFSSSILIICSSLFQVNAIGVTADAILMLSYLLAMILQVFIYCWHGNELMIISSKVCDAVYDSKWYDNSQKFKGALWVLQMRSQKINQLKAGSFCKLSLETFVAILKASYSYFTVLNKVNE